MCAISADMLPNVLVYIALVFRTAWGHSASLARNIIFYAIVTIGAVAFLVPPILGMTIDAAGLLSLLSNPKFYAILFGAIVLSRLLCAPYWIWQDDQKKIALLSAETRKHANKMFLHHCYAEIGGLIIESVSEADLSQYITQCDEIIMKQANRIEMELGAAARIRFLDLIAPGGYFPKSKGNMDYNQVLVNLTRIKNNLEELIKTEVWE